MQSSFSFCAGWPAVHSAYGIYREIIIKSGDCAELKSYFNTSVNKNLL